MFERKLRDALTAHPRVTIGWNDEAAAALTGRLLDGALDFLHRPNRSLIDPYFETRSRRLDCTDEELRLRRSVVVGHHCDVCQCGRHLLEKLKPFSANGKLVGRKTSRIATWLRQVRYKTLRNGIRHLEKDDWDRVVALRSARRLVVEAAKITAGFMPTSSDAKLRALCALPPFQ